MSDVDAAAARRRGYPEDFAAHRRQPGAASRNNSRAADPRIHGLAGSLHPEATTQGYGTIRSSSRGHSEPREEPPEGEDEDGDGPLSTIEKFRAGMQVQMDQEPGRTCRSGRTWRSEEEPPSGPTEQQTDQWGPKPPKEPPPRPAPGWEGEPPPSPTNEEAEAAPSFGPPPPPALPPNALQTLLRRGEEWDSGGSSSRKPGVGGGDGPPSGGGSGTPSRTLVLGTMAGPWPSLACPDDGPAPGPRPLQDPDGPEPPVPCRL